LREAMVAKSLSSASDISPPIAQLKT